MIDWDADCLAPTMAVFGQSVTYWAGPSIGSISNSFRIDISDAVFDEAFLVVQMLQDGSEVNSVRPTLGVRASWFVYQGVAFQPLQGDEVDIYTAGKGGLENTFQAPTVRRYRVIDVEPDGHGHVLLYLNKIGEAASQSYSPTNAAANA